MAQILVTGGSGFLGAWVLRRLLNDGHQVRVLVRPTSDRSELAGLNCEYVYGDVTDLPSLKAACTGQNAVFHLAGLIAYKRSQRAAMEKINVQGTANVIEAVEHAGVQRLVHLSSVVAIGAGYTPDQVLTEDSPYNVAQLDMGYFETKRKAEQLVREAVKSGRIDAVMLNPSTIYGPGDARKGSRKNQLKVAQGRMKFYTSGGVNVVHVENCVDGIVRGWLQGRSGERYILCGQNMTIRQLFQIIADCAGVSAPKVQIPDWLLHVVGITGDTLTGLGYPISVSRENAYTATMYHYFSSEKAQRELGFVPGDSRKAIEDSVRWSREHGLLNPGAPS